MHVAQSETKVGCLRTYLYLQEHLYVIPYSNIYLRCLCTRVGARITWNCMTREKNMFLHKWPGWDPLKRQWDNFNIVIRDLQALANRVTFYSSKVKQGCFTYNFLARYVTRVSDWWKWKVVRAPLFAQCERHVTFFVVLILKIEVNKNTLRKVLQKPRLHMPFCRKLHRPAHEFIVNLIHKVLRLIRF